MNQVRPNFPVDGLSICSDGIDYFGNTVDAGYVFVFPHDLAPQFMREQVTTKEQQ